MKIVGLTMLKNEAHILPHSLKSACAFCDEIVALIHECTDETEAILRACPQVVKIINYVGEWDEYEMRNKLIEAGKEFDPDWFVVFDGDEIYESEARTKFLNILQDKPNALCMTMRLFYCMGQTKYYYTAYRTHRAFKNFPGVEQKIKKRYIHVTVAATDTLSKEIKTNIRIKHVVLFTGEEAKVKLKHYKNVDPVCIGQQKSYAQHVRYAFDLASGLHERYFLYKVPFDTPSEFFWGEHKEIS